MKRCQSARSKRQLLEQQTTLNLRIERNNEQQNALTRSLQVYHQGKRYLAEKEDQLLRLTTIVDQLCTEVTHRELLLTTSKDKLQVQELEIKRLETELKAVTLETEKSQLQFHTLNQRLVDLLANIEKKGKIKTQEALELETKEQNLLEKTRNLDREKRDLERKKTVLASWEPGEGGEIMGNEALAKLKAELLVRDTQLHSQMDAYQLQQGQLMQLNESLKREFARIMEEKVEAERQKAELDLHDQQIDSQIRQFDELTASINAEIENFRRNIENEQVKKTELQAKKEKLAVQIEEERKINADLEGKLKDLQGNFEVYSSEMSILTAKDEELKRLEMEVQDEEMRVVREQRELEKREEMLVRKRERGEDLELKLESLMLSEDVYHRRHSKEMDVLSEVMERLRKRERELDAQLGLSPCIP